IQSRKPKTGGIDDDGADQSLDWNCCGAFSGTVGGARGCQTMLCAGCAGARARILACCDNGRRKGSLAWRADGVASTSGELCCTAQPAAGAKKWVLVWERTAVEG